MGIKIWTDRVASDKDMTRGNIRDFTPFRTLKTALPHSIAAQWPSNVIVDLRTRYEPADAFFCGTGLYVSVRLAEIFEKEARKGDLELLPVTVDFRGKKTPFRMAHPLVEIDAMDRARSDFKMEDGRVTEIKRLAIDEAKCDSHDFFLLTTDWVICVSERLAKAIEAARCRGVKFVEPAVWKPY